MIMGGGDSGGGGGTMALGGLLGGGGGSGGDASAKILQEQIQRQAMAKAINEGFQRASQQLSQPIAAPGQLSRGMQAYGAAQQQQGDGISEEQLAELLRRLGLAGDGGGGGTYMQ